MSEQSISSINAELSKYLFDMCPSYVHTVLGAKGLTMEPRQESRRGAEGVEAGTP